MDRPEIECQLGNCEFFKDIDKGEISRIATLCQLKSYETGEALFRQGDLGEYLYVVSEGYVYLQRSVDMAVRKGNVVIATLGPGRVLGCWSTVLGVPHHLLCSAICQKPTRVIVLKGSDLREMMLKKRDLGFSILEKLCFLLRERIEEAYGALERI